MVDFKPFHEELTKIREEISERIRDVVKKINSQTKNEPFYGRFITTDGRHLIGLISDLRMNKYNLVFNLTEEKLSKKRQIILKTSEQEIRLDALISIDVFKTKSGKPIFAG